MSRSSSNSRSRRGAVVLFALGVLAIIAVAAISYVTVVGQDRRSAESLRGGEAYARQADAVVEYIRALVAADLFGGKIVNRRVPREHWPAMFEDADFADFPSTHFDSLNTRSPDQSPSNGSILQPLEAGYRDDAWLAPWDPVWGSPVDFRDDFWPQITNLRAAYTYDDRGTPDDPDDDRWVRGDGRYADLAQYFFDSITIAGSRRGNPGTDLIDPDEGGPNSGPVDPIDGAGDVNRARFTQLNWLSDDDPAAALIIPPPDSGPDVTNLDERFFTDTDGDLRPDARWQRLDALGDLYGLQWFVAARIVDASGLVNYNSALEGGWPYLGQGQLTGNDAHDGRTPADVDLYRLLGGARQHLFGAAPVNSPSLVHREINQFRLRPAAQSEVSVYARHLGVASSTLPVGLRLPTVIEAIRTRRGVDEAMPNDPPERIPTGTGGPFWRENANPGQTTSATRLTRAQREAYWEEVGASPDETRVLGANPYAATDIIDLHGFSATNDKNRLSEIEAVMDGPEDTDGFLPPPTSEGPGFGETGPLIARGEPAAYRAWGRSSKFNNDREDARAGRPTIPEIRFSTRRWLTPYNGVSDASPVPVLNRDALDTWLARPVNPYEGRFVNRKVRLADFAPTDVPDAFEAFVWALAPLATDEYLSAELREAGLRGPDLATSERDPRLHYGGGYTAVDGPAAVLPFTPANVAESGASFAVLTSAQLAVNLADASDEDNTPTVGRFFWTDDTTRDPVPGIIDASQTDEIELGTRFSHGDLSPDLLDRDLAGEPLAADPIVEFNRRAVSDTTAPGDSPSDWLDNQGRAHGVTIVGLERGPALLEVFSAAMYVAPEGSSGVIDLGTDDSAPPSPRAGLIAVQLANPWPDPPGVSVSERGLPVDGYELWIAADENDLTSSTGTLVFSFPADTRIPAGQTMVFVCALDSGDDVSPLTGDYDDGSVLPAAGGDTLTAVLRRDLFNAFGDDSRIALNSMTARNAERSGVVFFHNASSVDPNALLVRRGVGVRPPAGWNGGEEPFAIVDRIVARGLDADRPFPAVPLDNDLGDDVFTWYDTSLPIDARIHPTSYFIGLGYDFAPAAAAGDQIARLDAGEVAGRYLVTSSLSRASALTTGGLPEYAVEFDEAVTDAINGEGVSYRFEAQSHAWMAPIDFIGNPPTRDPDPAGVPLSVVDFMDERLNSAGFRTLLGSHTFAGDATTPPDPDVTDPEGLTVVVDPLNKPATVPPGLAIASAQVFVPNGPLRFVSDLGRLSTYAHLYRHSVDTNTVQSLDDWRTVGQQLGLSLSANHAAGGDTNLFLGTLDTTRFIPGAPTYPDGIPEGSLSLPLALRVFDCFEALEHESAIAQGRVNVNTAPERVLQTLPYLAPIGSALNPLDQDTDWRSRLVYRYRDSWDPVNGAGISGGAFDFGTSTPDVVTGFDAVYGGSTGLLRRTDLNNATTFGGRPLGFAATGELAILDLWQGASGFITSGAPFGAATPQDAGFATALGGAFTPNLSDIDPWSDTAFAGGRGFQNPSNDQEERLALFRSISNIVSTRSDVFIAWFVVRGYDPDIIENIEVAGTSARDALTAFVDERFRPTYESRWLVVLDRSNVRQPTDRPEVVLRVELPIAKP